MHVTLIMGTEYADEFENLKSLKIKYIVKYTSSDFHSEDRTKAQYHYIVNNMKNLEASKYLLKWEHENKKRLPKNTADELILDPDAFFKNHMQD